MRSVEPEGRTAFELLGLRPEADQGEVSAAYRRLAMVTHPDVSVAHDAAERFTRLSAAYRQAMAAAAQRTGPAHTSGVSSVARPSPRATPTVQPIVAGPVHVESLRERGRSEDLLWVGPVVRLDRGGR